MFNVSVLGRLFKSKQEIVEIGITGILSMFWKSSNNPELLSDSVFKVTIVNNPFSKGVTVWKSSFSIKFLFIYF